VPVLFIIRKKEREENRREIIIKQRTIIINIAYISDKVTEGY
jgi:hypothetical protein